MPQPIDECLKYLGEILCADRKSVRPVVSIYANKVASKTVRNLVALARGKLCILACLDVPSNEVDMPSNEVDMQLTFF